MTPQDALVELLARVGASRGGSVLIGAQELREWPTAAVTAMKAHKLLVNARHAASVVCPGCEQQCVMPVHTIPTGPRDPAAFVVCDKRSDINRVAISIEHLKQWQGSGQSIADLIALLLDLRLPTGSDTNVGRWEVGMLKGSKHASHLVLLGDGELKLSLAGHSIALADVLEVRGDHFALGKRMLIRCVDQPVAGAGDVESAGQRRDRLRARVRAEKAKGTKAFLKVVADEEGLSVSRLKQLVRHAAMLAK